MAVGIGWSVRSSSSVPCSFARHLIVEAFNRGANGQHRTAVLGYVCTTRDLPDAEHINCVRGSNVVTTKSQGY